MRSGSEIAELQNSETMIAMLKAQRRLYTEAKRVKAVAAAICLGIPIVVTAVQLWTSLALPAPAACIVIEIVAFVVGIALTSVAERKIVTAASIQQRFDLELYWLGSHERAGLKKAIVEAAGRHDESGADQSKLLDWYGTSISGLEPIEAVRCCQQTNVSWSYKLGRLWLGALVLASLACLAALIVPMALLGVDTAALFFGGTIVEWLTLQLGDGISYLMLVRDLDKISNAIGVDSEADALRMQDLIFDYRKSRFKVPDFMFRMMHDRYSSIGDVIAAAERL